MLPEFGGRLYLFGSADDISVQNDPIIPVRNIAPDRVAAVPLDPDKQERKGVIIVRWRTLSLRSRVLNLLLTLLMLASLVIAGGAGGKWC